MNYLQSAQALYEQMVRDRRHLHQHPEVGMDLPETCSYVMARLTEMGYQPRRLGGGVTATLTGKPDGKVFLLRADMDAQMGIRDRTMTTGMMTMMTMTTTTTAGTAAPAEHLS